MRLQSKLLVATSAELAALLLHASKDASRPSLNGLAIDQAAGLVAASDGHRLLAWRGEPCGERKLVLPVRSLAAILAVKPGRSPRRKNKRAPPVEMSIALGAEMALCKSDGITVSFGYGDASMPPYEQVIPKRKAGDLCSCVAVSPKYLGDLATVSKALGMSLASVVLQPGPSDIDPLLCHFPGRPEWTAVLMPRRMDGTYSAVPKEKP